VNHISVCPRRRSDRRPCIQPAPFIIAAGMAVLAWSAAPTRAETPSAGSTMFEGACAGCHAAGSPRVLAGQPLLARTHAITGSDPSDAIRIILQGRQPPSEQRGPWMPGFAAILSDGQIAEILDWLRQEAGKPGWPGLDQQVEAQR